MVLSKKKKNIDLRAKNKITPYTGIGAAALSNGAILISDLSASVYFGDRDRRQ
jgi:hypothetical protein